MLSDDELSELLDQVKKGDAKAKADIVEKNINLVRSVVHRLNQRNYEWDDLFQIGCIGLLKAVERFDKNFHVKFSTYAVPMIIGEIKRFMRDDNVVKVSRTLKTTAYQIYKVQEKLQYVLGREPTISEISHELDFSPQEIAAALESVQPLVSLYEPYANDAESQVLLVDKIKQENHEKREIERLALEQELKCLSEKERQILIMRFYQDKTQSEIASIVGLSQVQVSRIEKKALYKMRNSYRA